MGKIQTFSGLKIIIFSCFLFACEVVIIENPDRIFTIPEGKHFSNHLVESFQDSSLIFEAVFDSTAIYRTVDPGQQSAINKLLGFSDCNSVHHENSARFGWRWLNDQLEIIAYTYVDGKRIEEFVGTANIGKASDYQIDITDEHYIFTLDDYPAIYMERMQPCDTGSGYLLYPYFGGQEVAPHTISIKISIQGE